MQCFQFSYKNLSGVKKEITAVTWLPKTLNLEQMRVFSIHKTPTTHKQKLKQTRPMYSLQALPIVHISQIIWMAPRQESNHLQYCLKHRHYRVKRAELAFVLDK